MRVVMCTQCRRAEAAPGYNPLELCMPCLGTYRARIPGARRVGEGVQVRMPVRFCPAQCNGGICKRAIQVKVGSEIHVTPTSDCELMGGPPPWWPQLAQQEQPRS